ncbi:prenyltransferase/squalene oxidase repeat-containing protein [Actinomadura keratinilytica]|uniref:prenyltransferase/squalene oxidase repeat-containing protein n=1 Tax=Actinomadura keratinilytica TaxID=547461 RepID=UPI0031EB085D
MTVGDAISVRTASADTGGPSGRGADLAAAARELVGGLLAEPWGQVSPSIYETGKLVTLAPWLTGHGRRVRYLLAEQRPDGGWGAPGGYAMVPTLSAVEALLTSVDRDKGSAQAAEPGELLAAAGRGLRLLERLLPTLDADGVPDMPAVDLIAASLIGSINRLLDDLERTRPDLVRDSWSPGLRLGLPPGLDDSRLVKIRKVLAAGIAPPDKVVHALETVADLARGTGAVRPAGTGTVGASPAATAAWLDERSAGDPGNPARIFLETVVSRHDGLAPCGYPITVFERGWVLSILARAGLVSSVPADLRTSLEDTLGPAGTPAAEGLPADADTSSGALYALALLGAPRPPDPLWTYETETHFCTWPGEDGFSVTTNAHALEAFGAYLRHVTANGASRATGNGGPVPVERYRATVEKLASVLCRNQHADGSWTDRWHVSPYYATMSCVLALERFGGPRAAAAVEQARRWVLDTRRPDGSWGLWEGTAEETAYAVQTLLPSADASEELRKVVARADEFLLTHEVGQNGYGAGPALWHDKDLYHPTAIVRASVLAARHLAHRHLNTEV